MTIRYTIEHSPAKTTFKAESDLRDRVVMGGDGIYVTLTKYTKPQNLDAFGDLTYVPGNPLTDSYTIHLGWLMQRKEPRGSARMAMCNLLQAGFAMGFLTPEDTVWLEASGDVNGDYTVLVQMYQRMGFDIYAYGDQGVYDRIMANQPVIISELAEDCEPNTLMAQTAASLLSWCGGRRFQ